MNGDKATNPLRYYNRSNILMHSQQNCKQYGNEPMNLLHVQHHANY